VTFGIAAPWRQVARSRASD